MVIHLQNVRYSYQNSPTETVLDIPHWSINDHERIFLQGPSGTGKTTLLNLLSGLITVAEGTVSVLGKQLNSMNSRQRDRFRATQIGYIFQQFNLIPYLNAVENIQLANHFAAEKHRATPEEVKALLEKLHIVDTDWKKPSAQLSIGQQQRVAIARALINKPQLLIADEPTSALDQANRERFLSTLTALVSEQPVTLLLVSHDLSLSSHCHKIVKLSDINRAGVNSGCL